MALSNGDNPVVEKPRKAAKAAEPAVELVSAIEPAPIPLHRPLASAAASSSPDVHRLLANRNAHVRAGDSTATAAVDAELAALGFAV